MGVLNVGSIRRNRNVMMWLKSRPEGPLTNCLMLSDVASYPRDLRKETIFLMAPSR